MAQSSGLNREVRGLEESGGKILPPGSRRLRTNYQPFLSLPPGGLGHGFSGLPPRSPSSALSTINESTVQPAQKAASSLKRRKSEPVTACEREEVAQVPILERGQILKELQKRARAGFSKATEWHFKKRYPHVERPRTPYDLGNDAKSCLDQFPAAALAPQVQSLIFRKMCRGIVLARQAVADSNEKSRHLHIFLGVLGTFAMLSEHFSGQRPIAVATLSEALGDTEDTEESEDGNFGGLDAEEVERLQKMAEGKGKEGLEQKAAEGEPGSAPPVLCYADNFFVCFEQWLKGNHCGGPVEFLIIDRETGKWLGVIEVKRSLDVANPGAALYQLHSQMAAALEHNGKHGATGPRVIWGMLTDGNRWIFSTLSGDVQHVRLPGAQEEYWVIKSGKIQRSHPYSLLDNGNPGSETALCLDRITQCLTPTVVKKPVEKVQEAFAKAEAYLDQTADSMADAFDASLKLPVGKKGEGQQSKQKAKVLMMLGGETYRVPVEFEQGSIESLRQACIAECQPKDEKFTIVSRGSDGVLEIIQRDFAVTDLQDGAILELRWM